MQCLHCRCCAHSSQGVEDGRRFEGSKVGADSCGKLSGGEFKEAGMIYQRKDNPDGEVADIKKLK